MATSGSFSTNHIAATSRVWYWDLSWWVHSWNGNTATIKYEVYSRCETGGSDRWVGNHGFSGSIAGHGFSSGDTFYNGSLIASGEFTLSGGSYFSADITAHPYSGSYTSSGSGSWTLDNNVVTPTVTCSVTRGLNTIGASMSVTNNGNASIVDRYIDLFTDSGCTNKVGVITGASGTFTGLNPNTTYYARANASNGTYRGYSAVKTVSTYDIAKITSHNDNFNVNSNSAVTCTASNPSGASMKYFVDLPNGTRRYTSNATTNKSYTWTATQILALLQYIPNNNSSTIKFGVATLVGGNETYWHGIVGTLNVVNSNPIFSNFTYADTNNTTLALTGNNQIVVKGYSSVKGIISAANKAVAQNGATMSKYRFVIGESQKEANYSSDAEVGITIANANNNTFNMYAIDSRGNSTLKTISPSTYKTYSNIAIKTAVAEREDNGIGSRVILSFSGSIWNNNFGTVNNEIVSCQYKYKKTTSSTWITGQTDITPVISGQTFSKTVEIKGDLGAEGFDIQASYDLQIIIRDKLSSYTINTLIGTGTPGLAITANGIAIFNMYDENLGGALQITGDLYVNGKKIN